MLRLIRDTAAGLSILAFVAFWLVLCAIAQGGPA